MNKTERTFLLQHIESLIDIQERTLETLIALRYILGNDRIEVQDKP